MARMHLHISVADIVQNTRFYTALFGTEPTVVKPDYVKWELTDPAVNFAISNRGRAPGARPRRHPGRVPGRVGEPPGPAGGSGHPGRGPGGHRLLLCPLGQVLGTGPAGSGLGDLPYPGVRADVQRG